MEFHINSKAHGNKLVILDDKFSYLLKYKWNIQKTGGKYYVISNTNDKRLQLHRMVLGSKCKNKIVDHIDGNGLNNSILNLRVCNVSQNCWNRRKTKNKKSSNYRGVQVIKMKIGKYDYKYYKVDFQGNGKRIQRVFKDELIAAKYYDELSDIYYKEFANKNFK